MSHMTKAHRDMNQLRARYREQRELLSQANKIINQGSPAFLPKTIEFTKDMRVTLFAAMNRTRAELRSAMRAVEVELNTRATMRAVRSTTGYRVGELHCN